MKVERPARRKAELREALITSRDEKSGASWSSTFRVALPGLTRIWRLSKGRPVVFENIQPRRPRYLKSETMSHIKILILLASGLALTGLSALAQDTASKPKLTVLKGPAKAPLGQVAQIDLPTGYVFINGKDYQALLKAEGEPVSGNELGSMRATNQHWSVVFEFSDIGYVKDDDKDKLNADKLIATIRRNNEEANKQRIEAGNPPIEVIGWEIPPKYDSATHNLEWAIRGAVQGQPFLNYNTRLLGRKGVMEVVLIVKPEQLGETLPTFRNLLAGYSFSIGNSYAEFRPGDKVAKYGLGALVLGGAAVGAAKLGLFTWLLVFLKKGWKLVVVAFVAVASFFKKLFTGRGNRPQQQ